jgi:hypothetical protein
MVKPKSLDGIIAHLREEGGEAVTISSKTQLSNKPPENLLDLASRVFFLSEDAEGQWIQWDFKAKQVYPTNYTIKGSTLITWQMEGSLDGTVWTEMDRRTEKAACSQPSSFDITKPTLCRFIRLTQTGANSGGKHSLTCAAVEFFGSLDG